MRLQMLPCRRARVFTFCMEALSAPVGREPFSWQDTGPGPANKNTIMSFRWRKENLLPAASILCALCALVAFIFTTPPVKVTRISFPVEGCGTAGAIVTEPPGRGEKVPVVFLLPGIISLADRFDAMAGELARYGYASCALYFPDDNTRRRLKVRQEAARHLERHMTAIDSSRRAYFGHSLGGTTAVDAAYFDPSASAAVSVGYYIGGELAGSPGNLLIGTGLYDDLNDLPKMRSSITSVTGGKVGREGVRSGDFSQRTARELFVSPYSNHASEKEDFMVIERLVEWLDLSFNGQSRGTYPLMYCSHYLASFLLCISLLYLLVFTALNRFKAEAVSGLWLAGFCFLLVCMLFRLTSPLAVTAFMLLLCSGFLLSRAGLEPTADLGAAWFDLAVRRWGISSGLWCLSFAISQFLFNIPLCLPEPRFFLAFPGYMYITFFICPLSYVNAFISFTWHEMPWLLVLCGSVAVSVWSQDRFSGGALMKSLVQWKRKFQQFLLFRRVEKVPPGQAVLLFMLVCAGIMAWFSLFRAGLLYCELRGVYARFILRYGVVPLRLWGVVMRLLTGGKGEARTTAEDGAGEKGVPAPGQAGE